MLTFEGTGYWHDKQHGWAFQKGDKIKLELAGKGYIKLSLCQYSGDGELKLLAPDGTTVLGTTANKVSSDGANATIQYDGAQGAGILTLEIPATSYIHSISIRNQAEDPYMVDGDIFVVKRGATDVESGKNLLSMLELANGFSGTDRKIIFLPNGTYDLEETVLTAISRNNISLIGESMEGTIIKNAPDISIEGIGTTATLLNTSTGLYMQDLTLQNALDYYGAQRTGLAGGRAVCLQDKGKRTICKNVKMLSYQDTYYSNANNQFYWEDSEIHGTVDYLCGGGDVYYNGCTFVNESRSAEGKTGSDVIRAPYTDASNKFGYVFNNCTIENHAASFSLGRAWGGNSTSVWLNTTINQPKEIIDTRFTLAGMNVAAYKFKEYNSMDTEGNVVSPASLVETFTKDSQKYTYDIILSDEEAAEFTLDKVFTNWAPNEIAKQAIAPAFVKLEGTNLTWEDNKSAKIWAVLKNGSVIDFVDAPSYTVDDATAEYAIRAANTMGGLSSAVVANSYVNVTLASVGYATFYDSKNAYILPAELKAYAVSNANTSELTYKEVGNIIPAGTAVMLESADKTGGEFLLSPTDAKVTYQGTNMLKGSDVATTTFAEQNSLFYKLSFGSSKTAQAGSFGWFWGAADGGAFEIEAHRAWLAIPVLLNTPAISYIIGTGGEGTTAIKNIENKQEATGEYYNLQGQRVDVPTKGLYIHNGKKVIIK
jgi:pectin methylesterase-like acyl-CoA thioesterase